MGLEFVTSFRLLFELHHEGLSGSIAPFLPLLLYDIPNVLCWERFLGFPQHTKIGLGAMFAYDISITRSTSCAVRRRSIGWDGIFSEAPLLWIPLSTLVFHPSLVPRGVTLRRHFVAVSPLLACANPH